MVLRFNIMDLMDSGFIKRKQLAYKPGFVPMAITDFMDDKT